MAYKFPEGSKFFFSQTFATARTLTAITNANPAVATNVTHGYTTNSEVLISSGWEDATDSVFRVTSLTADTFSIQGLDTTNTAFFAPGGGAGSTARLVSNWIEIPQVLTIGTQGGDTRFSSFTPIARRNGINVPIGFNPSSIQLTLGHDMSLAAMQTMLAISRTFTQVAFRMSLADGSSTYGYGYLSLPEVANISSGNPNQVTATLTMSGRTISY